MSSRNLAGTHTTAVAVNRSRSEITGGARAHLEHQALLGAQDGVIRSRLHARKRTRDIISAAEERIAVLKAELAETDHHMVGLSNGEISRLLFSYS